MEAVLGERVAWPLSICQDVNHRVNPRLTDNPEQSRVSVFIHLSVFKTLPLVSDIQNGYNMF